MGGGILGLLLIVAVCIIFILRRKHNKKVIKLTTGVVEFNPQKSSASASQPFMNQAYKLTSSDEDAYQDLAATKPAEILGTMYTLATDTVVTDHYQPMSPDLVPVQKQGNYVLQQPAQITYCSSNDEDQPTYGNQASPQATMAFNPYVTESGENVEDIYSKPVKRISFKLSPSTSNSEVSFAPPTPLSQATKAGKNGYSMDVPEFIYNNGSGNDNGNVLVAKDQGYLKVSDNANKGYIQVSIGDEKKSYLDVQLGDVPKKSYLDVQAKPPTAAYYNLPPRAYEQSAGFDFDDQEM